MGTISDVSRMSKMLFLYMGFYGNYHLPSLLLQKENILQNIKRIKVSVFAQMIKDNRSKFMSHLVRTPAYPIPFTLRRTYLWTMQTGRGKYNHFLLATLFKNEGQKIM